MFESRQTKYNKNIQDPHIYCHGFLDFFIGYKSGSVDCFRYHSILIYIKIPSTKMLCQ